MDVDDVDRLCDVLIRPSHLQPLEHPCRVEQRPRLRTPGLYFGCLELYLVWKLHFEDVIQAREHFLRVVLAVVVFPHAANVEFGLVCRATAECDGVFVPLAVVCYGCAGFSELPAADLNF